MVNEYLQLERYRQILHFLIFEQYGNDLPIGFDSSVVPKNNVELLKKKMLHQHKSLYAKFLAQTNKSVVSIALSAIQT